MTASPAPLVPPFTLDTATKKIRLCLADRNVRPTVICLCVFCDTFAHFSVITFLE